MNKTGRNPANPQEKSIMARTDIINVIGDVENFLDSLLAHTEEENCTHSVSDFLQEYFDKKNERRAASQQYLQTRANTTSATPTSQEGEDDHY